jgi:protein-S-isoprenylcysteine O-methyltransferase Ste14
MSIMTMTNVGFEMQRHCYKMVTHPEVTCGTFVAVSWREYCNTTYEEEESLLVGSKIAVAVTVLKQ